MFFAVFPRIVIEFFLDILFFPLWWYTGGMVYALGAAGSVFATGNGFLAPGLWLKNLFVPMFGQHDLQGRLVSFIIRLGNVIFRGFALLIWSIIVFALLLVWVLAPLAIGYMLILTLAS